MPIRIHEQKFFELEFAEFVWTFNNRIIGIKWKKSHFNDSLHRLADAFIYRKLIWNSFVYNLQMFWEINHLKCCVYVGLSLFSDWREYVSHWFTEFHVRIHLWNLNNKNGLIFECFYHLKGKLRTACFNIIANLVFGGMYMDAKMTNRGLCIPANLNVPSTWLVLWSFVTTNSYGMVSRSNEQFKSDVILPFKWRYALHPIWQPLRFTLNLIVLCQSNIVNK